MAFDPLTGRWTPTEEEGAYPAGLPVMDYWGARTPREDWERFAADLPGDPRYRRGWASMMPRLEGRYMLAQPFMGTAPEGEDVTATPYGTSFAQFLSDFQPPIPTGYNDSYYAPSYRAHSLAALQQRARQASAAAMASEVEATQFGGSPQMTAYYGMFGQPAESAYANQMAVAQMLARQRQGGGQYRGRLGDAIGRAVASMARGRQAVGAPKTSFLDWYLGQTGAAPLQMPG
jgi:hypothetical protein